MEDRLLVSVLTGLCQIGASLCILANEVLLNPRAVNYPNAPHRLRYGMFGLGAMLLYFGVGTLQRTTLAEPLYVRDSLFPLSALWFYVTAAHLEKTLRQWLPERVQRRVHQLWDFASCRQARLVRRQRIAANAALREGVTPQRPDSAAPVGPALVELALDGVHVFGPGEAPESRFNRTARH